MNRSIIRPLLGAFFLSTLLISCSGGSSSNKVSESKSTSTESRSFTTTVGDGTTVTNNGVEISVDANGVPTIVNDPTNQATITQNTDGGLTINTGENSSVMISPDGNFVTTKNNDSTVIINGVEQ